MQYYVGMDVSLKETAICVIDTDGDIVEEMSVMTEPEVIAATLKKYTGHIKKAALETGNLSAWLWEALHQDGMPIVCIEARHASKMLKAQLVKTDKNDARGLAQIVRAGWYKAVHIKSNKSQHLRVLLKNRCLLVNKKKDIDNQIRGTLKIFGMKMGQISHGRYETRVRELIADDLELLSYVEPLLKIRAYMLDQLTVYKKMVMNCVRADETCRRFMSVPGVGVITALTFRATIDDPERFKRSRNVGAHLGLTPRKYASGEIDYNGRITKCGDPMLRSYLFEAAQVIMRRTSRPTSIKEWGNRIAQRSSMKNACVAVARKLSVILHRMWIDGTEFYDPLWETKNSKAVS